MKNKLSIEVFKDFIENIDIVKKCQLTNNEAVIELNNRNVINVILAIAAEGYPKEILNIVSNLDIDSYYVIIAPYISEHTSNICKNAKVGYLDISGNCYISCDCLYIDIKGNKNKNISKRGLRSIYERSSVVSSNILRTMLEDVNKTWKMNDLKDVAGCSIGQVAKVKDFLLKQAYIEDTKHGFKIVDLHALLKDWANVYNNSSEEKIACYSLDDISSIEAKLIKMNKDTGVECILTGFSGGSRYQPVVRYNQVHAYVDNINLKKVIDYLGLKRVDTGANVILIVTYNDFVKLGAKNFKGNLVASPVQLYLDCMGIKGRGEEMAEAILEREICK